MVQRKSARTKEVSATTKENGIVNGHVNGKTTQKVAKSFSNESTNDSPKVKPVNRQIAEKMERKRTTSFSKTQNAPALEKRPNQSSLVVDSRGDSMAALLTQGLMANDGTKIDAVLEKTNTNVIQATLSELPSTEVIPLLRAIESRLRTRKALDIRPWIRWAQGCMSMHLSYLSSQPSLESTLGGLLDWMRNRTSHMEKLLTLHGKMTVLVEEMEKRRGGSSTSHSAAPLVVFNDEEDKSDEEMESMSGDEDERDTSEEEDWWDDGGVAAKEESEDEGDDDDDDSDDDGGEDDSDDDGEGEGGESDDDEGSDDAMEV